MRERAEMILKLVCLGLGAYLFYQTSRISFRKDPLGNINLAATLSVLSPPEPAPGKKDTNSAAQKTNSASQGTNQAPRGTNALVKGTNLAGTNALAFTTNIVPQPILTNILTAGTNAKMKGTISAALITNVAAKGTNEIAKGTNLATPGTNVAAKSAGRSAAAPAASSASGRSSGPGRAGGPAAVSNIPAPVQGRIDKITQSEILGPVVRPLPMALIGLAGKDAFIRAPNGQTGLMKEGDELGGLKLLRIGTNRVLVEHESQQKELMLFSGLGSETLMPKSKDKNQ